MLEAQVQLGLTYYSMGRAADALSLWSEVLQRQPERQDAQMYLRMVSGGEAVPVEATSESAALDRAGPVVGADR